MRRKDKEVMDPQKLEAIIERALVLRIALFDECYPYLVPVNFGYRNGKFYFHSASEGKKLDLIKRDNRICFETEADVALMKGDVPCKWSTRYASIIGFGRAHFIQDVEEKRKGLEIIFQHYAAGPLDVPNSSLAQIAVVEIEVESMTAKVSGQL